MAVGALMTEACSFTDISQAQRSESQALGTQSRAAFDQPHDAYLMRLNARKDRPRRPTFRLYVARKTGTAERWSTRVFQDPSVHNLHGRTAF